MVVSERVERVIFFLSDSKDSSQAFEIEITDALVNECSFKLAPFVSLVPVIEPIFGPSKLRIKLDLMSQALNQLTSLTSILIT